MKRELDPQLIQIKRALETQTVRVEYWKKRAEKAEAENKELHQKLDEINAFIRREMTK